MPTSGNTVGENGLEMKFTVEQGQKFFPITHRKAIVGLSVNTLTLSQSLEIDVSEADNTITINPVVQNELDKINQSIIKLDNTLRTEINNQIANLWERVNGINYALSSKPGGPANTAMKLDSPFMLNIAGDANGSVSIDGSKSVVCNVTVNRTRNNYAGAQEDGGAANSSLRLNTARKIEIIGDMLGSCIFDGSENVTIETTKNHTHDQYSLTTHNHDDRYSLLGHVHNYAGSSSAGGSADSALKLTTPRTITLTGSVTGSVTFDGSENVSINTTTNHTHNQYSLTSHNHDGRYALASHSHAYLPTGGGTMTGNLGNNARYYQNGVLANLTAVQSGGPSTGNVLWAW